VSNKYEQAITYFDRALAAEPSDTNALKCHKLSPIMPFMTNVACYKFALFILRSIAT